MSSNFYSPRRCFNMNKYNNPWLSTVKNFCSKHNYKLSIISPFVVRIATKTDEWIIKYNGKIFTLYHYLDIKDHIHIQRRGKEIGWILKEIERHEEYMLCGRSVDLVKQRRKMQKRVFSIDYK